MNVHITSSSQMDNPQNPSELLLQSAIDSLPSHVAMLNEQAAITSVNAAWCDFGAHNDYSDPQYGLGTNYLQVCETATGQDANEAETVADSIRKILNERESVFRLEYPCHSPDTKRWFTLQIARFEWQGNLRVITAHQNVTDLKRAQLAYAQNEKRLQTIINTVVDGIFAMNEQGIIESVNPAMCEMFGYQPAELIGQHFQRLLPEPYRTQYIDYLRRHRQVSTRRYAEIAHEIKGTRKDGSEFPLYLAMSRAYLDRHWLFTGIVQDLTPRKRMEHEIREKQALEVELDQQRDLGELKNRFMSMISHELRTPLSVILLSSDFLRRYGDRMPEDEKAEAIATIQVQVRYLENMVGDISALSRADSLDQSIRAENVDLVDLCSDVVANAQILSADTHTILLDTHGHCPSMLADAKLLRQAFSNLLNNAIKYSPSGSTIRFECMCSPHEAVIKVIDQGIGIPEEDQPKLFEPFHRATNVGTRQGTGLGLAVTKRAIEMHHGTITFTTRPDIGTTFIVTLPIMDHVDE